MQGAGGVGGLLVVTDHGSLSTDHFYPTYDGNGNVSEYLDGTGAIVAHYEYDPFGRIVVESGSQAADFAHRFSTKPVDSVTGLLYYGYRWYDPVTGRWPSRDPIEEEGGINLYGFVGNEPIYKFDQLGLQTNSWYADGRVITRVHNTDQKGRDQIAAGEAISTRDWTIALDGSGNYRVDQPNPIQNSAIIVAAARAHEMRHIDAVTSSPQNHAIPYKQVFCLVENGVVNHYYWTRRSGTLKREKFNPDNDKLKWVDGTWILFMTIDSFKHQENAELTIEIQELRDSGSTSNVVMRRIQALEQRRAEVNATKGTGYYAQWNEFKNKHNEEKPKPGFRWYDSEKVYEELKN
jgi:RHS repeat-associated protein